MQQQDPKCERFLQPKVLRTTALRYKEDDIRGGRPDKVVKIPQYSLKNKLRQETEAGGPGQKDPNQGNDPGGSRKRKGTSVEPPPVKKGKAETGSQGKQGTTPHTATTTASDKPAAKSQHGWSNSDGGKSDGGKPNGGEPDGGKPHGGNPDKGKAKQADRHNGPSDKATDILGTIKIHKRARETIDVDQLPPSATNSWYPLEIYVSSKKPVDSLWEDKQFVFSIQGKVTAQQMNSLSKDTWKLLEKQVKEFRDTFTRIAVNRVLENVPFDYQEKSDITKKVTALKDGLQLSADEFAGCTWGPVCQQEPPTEKILKEWMTTLPETPLITLVQIQTQIQDKKVADLNMLWGLIYEAFKGQLDFHLKLPHRVYVNSAFNLMALFLCVWIHFSRAFRKYLD